MTESIFLPGYYFKEIWLSPSFLLYHGTHRTYITSGNTPQVFYPEVTMEPRKQRGIVIAAVARIVQQNGVWIVPSQTKPAKTYLVNLEQGTCTCPDRAEWGYKCKHMFAAETVASRENRASPDPELSDPESVVLSLQRKTYRQNWPAYNEAQTKEKERFQRLLHDLCKHLKHETENKVGRPRVPLSDVVFATAFKVYSTVSTRRFATDLNEAYKLGYITRPLHYNSICAYLERKDLTPVLHEMIERSSLPLKAVETNFAVDSTGFSTSRFVRWFDEKYGVTRSGHDWVKVHIMTGVKTNVVTAIEIRKRTANDAPLYRPLMKKTARNFEIKEVSADKAYSSAENIDLTFDLGGTPFIPFKSNASDAEGGLWGKMLHYYLLKRDEFMEHYHQRSNAESTFSMIKAKFRDHVRSRTDDAMKNEVLCKVLCHNICCVIQSQCELGVEPVFWSPEREAVAEVASI